MDQLVALCAEFVQDEGLTTLWKDLGHFAPEEFVEDCRQRLGYRVEQGNRDRMLRVLLDLAGELGWLRRDGDGWRWAGRFPEVARAWAQGGEVVFFRACLAVAPAYLRGADGIAFDAAAESLWDGFLSAPIYSFGRRWLLNRTRLEDSTALRCVDIGYGTGQSTIALCRRFPQARKLALDANGCYRKSAEERVAGVLGGGADTVAWVPLAAWCQGFSDDLPFPADAVDLVFFSCGEPYVPGERREAIYREVCRILKPGGHLLMLTWPYPDPFRPCDPALRRRALFHDFAESVCSGWHGFVPAGDTERALRRAGFGEGCVGAFPGLQGAGWIAEKGGGS